MKRLKIAGLAGLILWMGYTTWRIEGAIWLAEQICQAGGGDMISIVYWPFSFPQHCPLKYSVFPQNLPKKSGGPD